MKNLLAMILMGCLLLSSSCSKEEEPECTDCIGSFRCLVDGEEWKPNCDSGTILWGCSAIDCQYYNDTKRMNFRVVNEEKGSRLLLACYDLEIGENPVYYGSREYKDYTRGNCASYDMIRSMPNHITILSLDTINHTIEGTFGLSVLGRCDQDTIHITDGYFHLGYRF